MRTPYSPSATLISHRNEGWTSGAASSHLFYTDNSKGNWKYTQREHREGRNCWKWRRGRRRIAFPDLHVLKHRITWGLRKAEKKVVVLFLRKSLEAIPWRSCRVSFPLQNRQQTKTSHVKRMMDRYVSGITLLLSCSTLR